MRESPNGHIKQVDGYWVVEPGRTTPTEIGAIYRDLAVFCIENRILRVLVKPGDDDAAGKRDLCAAGVDTRIFHTEDNATRWLAD